MATLLTKADDLPAQFRGGAVAVGNFDGVHLGHQSLIRRLTEMADELAGPAIVMTFDPPPQRLLFPDRATAPPLTPMPRRAELIGACGAKALLAYPTSTRLLNMSPEEFFKDILVGKLAVQGLVEGPNFRFGKDRKGDTRLLQELCDSEGVDLNIVQPAVASEEMISSTRIRDYLIAGDIREANQLLGRNYCLTGTVVPGARRGRELGFATANLGEILSLIPSQGVYAGVVSWAESRLPAAINIGPNPTFSDDQDKLEIHILDWDGDLYGETVTVELHSRIRGLLKFASADELKQQISKDIQQCRQSLQSE